MILPTGALRECCQPKAWLEPEQVGIEFDDVWDRFEGNLRGKFLG